MEDVDFAVVAPPEPVYAAESLGHAVESGQIAYEMVGRNINADFAGAGADEVDRLLRRFRAGQEPAEDGMLDESIALQPSKRPGQLAGSILRKFPGDLLHIFHPASKNEHRSTGVFESSEREVSYLVAQLVQIPVGVQVN